LRTGGWCYGHARHLTGGRSVAALLRFDVVTLAVLVKSIRAA